MATVQDILQADSYAGNANLGGANAPAIQIDTKPLQQLALYTQFYNKTLYDQAVTDRDAKIKEVADVAKIDLNNVWGKDKDEMANDLNNLKTKAADYARNGTRTVQDELDWQTSIGDVMNKYNSAKQRAVTYQTQLNDINSSTDNSDQKQIKLKALNDKFNTTDISTPISSATGYKPININLPQPVVSTVSAMKLENNKNTLTSNDISFFNPLASAPVAMNAVNGVNSLLNSAKGVDKDLQATSTGEAQTWAGMKDTLNSVIASKGADGKFKYFDDNNKFLYDKFKQDNASNTAIMQPIDAMMGLNNYSQQHQNELKSGQFSDEGVNYNAPSTLTPDTFAAGIINITPDGVQANQLALAGMYTKYLGDKNEKKVTALKLGIEQQNANSESSKAALGWANLKLDKDKWKATQTVGTEAMQNTALDKAKRIYNEMAALADKNGVISPDKVRQLNVEQLKYLGVEQPTEVDNNGIKTQVSGYKPLSLTDKDGNVLPVAIQLQNGQIKVLKNAQQSESGSGSYKGTFDPTSSTNITNVATNILNEQVKNASGKELNAYNPVNTAANGTEQPSFSQPAKKTISSADIHTRALAAGYSDEEYKKVLIKNGVKITD
jgi:hypothetical protein